MEEWLEPVTPEFLRSLCDYAVVDAARVAEEGPWMQKERLLRAEESWPEKIYTEARSLHVTPSRAALSRVVEEAAEWVNLRLLIIHGGDITIEPAMYVEFLRKWPAVTLWAQNLMEEPPADLVGRVRVLPLFEQDRRWRGGEERVRVLIGGPRATEILYPFCGYTNRVRPIWLEQARELRGRCTGLEVIPYPLPKEEYEEALADARAVVCPPGNGVDTHRVWETIYKGGWAIVQDNGHTRQLLNAWLDPPLPLLPVRDATALADLVVPAPPAELHPIMRREWWRREALRAAYAPATG